MSNPEEVLRELSLACQAKNVKCETLKGKTPDQIRVLAQFYYSRARHTEKRERLATDALRSACAEIQRLRQLAYEMTEGGL